MILNNILEVAVSRKCHLFSAFAANMGSYNAAFPDLLQYSPRNADKHIYIKELNKNTSVNLLQSHFVCFEQSNKKHQSKVAMVTEDTASSYVLSPPWAVDDVCFPHFIVSLSLKKQSSRRSCLNCIFL